MNIIQTIILAAIEGITEFLPVSSTGHMILASSLMNIHDNAFVKSFEIAIQIGAIGAIIMLYYKRFLKGIKIYIKLGIAFIPTAVIGFLAYKTIKMHLFNPLIVSTALIVGGVILILVDKRVVNSKTQYMELEDISYKHAILIGLAQCVSMIPGVSRAAATIIGGVFNGLNKKQATEFSFLLAVPTMCAATGYDLIKTDAAFSSYEQTLLVIGFAVAFIFAYLAVKIFLKIVENYGFKYFGYYRILIGLVFIIYAVR
ncbi:MAG TPA: undecaprenyl-diphosphate phosphatase [Smithella sp.]|jgi:undecaprenyl-diphosphatase|nr:undecaprenyl-diphosphate phosphatase [Smithella sp.]HOE32580.1 undecaprenyl-diphosphate phosphatase [Smithella sp.]HOG09191.1 undecaprenyl-diphosphate phosphatase [Smithella sp.]HOO35913.1 undecaprenyl-diphosphate phosphatase [Smithella sp.]HOS13285.1 undecaprenyl-diphosphate phosphatase [Smithella sp.]